MARQEEINRELQRIEKQHFCTIALEEFLKRNGCFTEKTEVLDMGSGIGVPIYHYYKMNPNIRFLGIDHREDCVNFGNEEAKKRGASGISLELVNWKALPENYKNRFDGVISTHSLCCMKKVEDGLIPILELNPRWIGINSLFYDGPLDVLTHIRRHNDPEHGDDNPDGDFNIFSMDNAVAICANYDYKVQFEPFYPPEPIPRREDKDRGTFTMKTEYSDRTQFSGPVLLPWYFLLATKK